ncbi:MAG: 16S rRNA (adenine(1518)-N(6)/adenine(1519)-N(6))-dimethyltransferase RsmA [Acidobacteriota bacterium]
MRARRRFGQHFLERAWVDKLVEVIAPQAVDQMLEIGPGRGALTLALAPLVSTLIAVEIDRDLVARLRPRLPPHARVVEGNFLRLQRSAFLPADSAHDKLRVVGNLPYAISSPILFRLLSLARDVGGLSDATLMLQREVAERLAAGPGSRTYGVLSIHTRMDADAALLMQLPPGAFRPRPEVWSGVVRLVFRPPAVPLISRAEFDGVVRSLFAQRRKTTANALKSLARARGLDARQVLDEAGVDGSRRPETLDLPELARVADVLASATEPSVV